MTNRVTGPGVSLPQAQALYPANLLPQGIPFTPPSNEISLAPGQSIVIPAGDWMIDLGKYSILEYQDPTNFAIITQTVGVWRVLRSQRGSFPIRSDGINFRISNLTGCAVAAVVTTAGQTYVQSTTTVTPSTGNSTWQAVIGGRVASLTCSSTGSNFGVAPLVYMSAPPSPGVQATAVATISGGAINGFTMINQGAGYTSAPTVTILQNPLDPNLGTTTPQIAAVAAASLTGSGTLCAVLCTNNGNAVASSMTLTIAGAGTSAAASAVFMSTITALTASALGSGTITGAALLTTGGIPVTSGHTNPAIEGADFIPRQPNIIFPVASGNIGAAQIVDGGLFLGTATPVIVASGGLLSGVAPQVTLTQGGANDTVVLQPL